MLYTCDICKIIIKKTSAIKKYWFVSKEWSAAAAAAAAKSLQLCPTLCDPIDGSPPSSPNPGDSPGKNTGVGCHFLLQGMVYSSYNDPIYPEVEVKLTLTVIFEVQYL